MFSIKILNQKNKTAESIRTIKNIVSFVLEKVALGKVSVLSDDLGTEIVTGVEDVKKDGVVIELMIKKYIVINNEDFSDRESLNKHLTKIKHFCEQAKEIEDLKYLPINMR